MYKVEDKVKIREWDDMAKEFGIGELGSIKCKCSFTAPMRKYCGKVGVIRNTNESEICGIIYELEFGNESPYWGFSDDMFEKSVEVEESAEIKIYQEDKKVIALDTSTGRRGIVLYDPESELDFYEKAKLALERLTEEKVEFKPPMAIWCETEKEYELLCDYLDKAGYRWTSENKMSDYTPSAPVWIIVDDYFAVDYSRSSNQRDFYKGRTMVDFYGVEFPVIEEFNVGDIVRVIDNGKSYTTHIDFFIDSEIDKRLLGRYSYMMAPKNGEEYRIVAIGNVRPDEIDYVIEELYSSEDYGSVYLIEKSGVVKAR